MVTASSFPAVLAACAMLIRASTCQSTDAERCRYLPTDAEWPSNRVWNELNTTVGGRLISTIPLAAVCHDPIYDAVKCEAIRNDWVFPLTQPCELGNYVGYSINASSAADIAAGVKFAKENNIRLVIKNTGHDFLGRSTGTGGLGIWTHNLRESQVFPAYRSQAYNGPAIKLGAGTRAFEALNVAHDNGLRVISGNCPTMGVVGGYLLGGGSGPLSSFHGMAADQTLEFEVVTAAGDTIVASPTENTDLYWALSGGGGGTYGVVVSVTIRAFEDGRIGGASLSFSRQNVSTGTVYTMMEDLIDAVPALIDAGMQFGWTITRTAFSLGPITAPGFTVEQLRAAMGPFTTKLNESGIEYQLDVTSFPTYKDHFEHYLGPTPAGIYRADAMAGSRLIPRESLAANRTALAQAARNITENSFSIVTFIAANNTESPTKQPIAPNAVVPQWRRAAILALVTLPWNFTIPHDEMLGRQRDLQQSVVPQLRNVVPSDAGTYLNEAEVGNENWKQDFFGENYDRLLEIKRAHDPADLFYAEYAVGSDAWYRAPEGRLCRA
ncbi:hypothetical protein F66182_956 [Fusarium sp. NRRL 66182]|nr:hypothetical protein F66182_956 [Fusarium sp. NRRL 66182]